jgi:hypothetical protein
MRNLAMSHFIVRERSLSERLGQACQGVVTLIRRPWISFTRRGA